MFSINDFKRKVRAWMTDHPNATASELVDFCEELIPVSQYSQNHWLVEQTVSWFEHTRSQRDGACAGNDTKDRYH